MPNDDHSLAATGWLLDDERIRLAISALGLQCTIKGQRYTQIKGIKSVGSSENEDVEVTRVLFLGPRSRLGYLPRVAVVTIRHVDDQQLTEVEELLHLVSFGQQRYLFSRRRLFNDTVKTRDELIEMLVQGFHRRSQG